MQNFTWDYSIIDASELPEKVQRFIDVAALDVSFLRFMLLIENPDGAYIKGFDDIPDDAVGDYNRLEGTVYFFKRVEVGVAIHELMHYYLDVTDCDVRSISEKYIAEYGMGALSNYACVSMLNDKWDDVVCEIVAVYGRRGQFDKIKELLNIE